MLIISIACLFLAGSGKTLAPHKDSKDVIVHHVEEWWNAWAIKDSAVFTRMADEAFVEFTGNHTRRLEGKRQLLEVARSVFPLLEIETIKITEPTVVFHPATAICNYYFYEKGSFDKKAFTDSGCATDVFVKKKGGWKLVAHHGTKFNKLIKSN